MGECFIDYTVINSQPSEDRLTELLDALVSTFGLEESAEDLFWHGVFFKPQNYVNYEFDYDGIDFEVPSALCSECGDYDGKVDYVKGIMGKVMRGEIRKPEWMRHVELEMTCNEFGQAPSSFLFIEAKDDRYRRLADALLSFLYSPNMVITMCRA